jgi:hypothetical protein
VRYETLGQLKGAIELGHLSGLVLMLDNDNASVYVGQEFEPVFEMHPDELLGQALDLLGIPHEHV